jgi:hypothetical protein
MLELITLSTIKKIFNNANCEVSSMSKMLYVNCLMHHFGDLSPIEENSVGFELLDTEVKFNVFKKNFQELKKAGILEINFDGTIVFFPLWLRYIDKSLLTKKPIAVVDNQKIERVLNESQAFLDLVCMKHSITILSARNLIKRFSYEQYALGKHHPNENEIKNHFLNWVKFNLNNEKKIVKSNAKILGDKI